MEENGDLKVLKMVEGQKECWRVVNSGGMIKAAVVVQKWQGVVGGCVSRSEGVSVHGKWRRYMWN